MLITENVMYKIDSYKVCDYNKVIAKQELINSISKMTNIFKRFDIRLQSKIAIALEPSADFAIAIYAIVLFGCCYIPLDINQPIERLAYIIRNSNVSLVIGLGENPSWCQSKWFDINLLNNSENQLYLNNVLPESLSAILYTSGSTGKPKGVSLSHRAMKNFVDWSINEFGINENDNICNIAPFHFDLSILDIFTSISVGASLYIMPRNYTVNLVSMKAWLIDNKISIIYTVPSLLNFLADRNFFGTNNFENLRLILFAGEVMPINTIRKLVNLMPDTKFYNLYGPTETNVCCYWPVNKSTLDNYESLPIGYPACSASLKIDTTNSELLVKGDLLMSGYLENSNLEMPIDSDGFYRTGDKVSYNEHGELLYHGRLDDMIKYYGHRIAPIEIENVIRKSDLVKEVIVFSIDNIKQNIIACIITNQPNIKRQLYQFLTNHLPQYMIPTELIEFEIFPKLSNGKYDKLKLKQDIKALLSDSK